MSNCWHHTKEDVTLGLSGEFSYTKDVYVKLDENSLEFARVEVRDYNPYKVYASTKNMFRIFDNLDDAQIWVDQIILADYYEHNSNLGI